jgi:hypothetical protein
MSKISVRSQESICYAMYNNTTQDLHNVRTEYPTPSNIVGFAFLSITLIEYTTVAKSKQNKVI